MLPELLTPDQDIIRQWQQHPRVFVQGPAGCGKTTAAKARLLALLNDGVPYEKILILVPQRILGLPYQQLLRQPELPPGSQAAVVTLGGLAQRMAALFWPLVARQAGFAHPNQPPVFLTLETAQYFLARIVKPLMDEGYFESITIDRARLYSQIIDNLNKAASIGFSPTSISEKLKSAWSGKPGQEIVYEQAQDCALRFREFCLENNLLDFSLQLDLFSNHLWPSFIARSYLTQNFRHLIYDNTEEDIPVAHDILREWLPEFESSLLLYDTQAGYRAFLGADPSSTLLLQSEQDLLVTLTDTFVTRSSLQNFETTLTAAISRQTFEPDPEILESFTLSSHRFYPELTQWVCDQIVDLVNQGVPPGQIAVLAPYLTDSLRFSLTNRLQVNGIATRSHRPSRSLRDEPATLCFLTYAAMAYPDWSLPIMKEQMRSALMQSIVGVDLVRADLMAQTLFSSKPGNIFKTFDSIKPDTRERITFTTGERYEAIRNWFLNFHQQPTPELDVFISRIFGELLSQPGFGFHQNYESAQIAANLIESIQKFRQVTGPILQSQGLVLGHEYIQMVQEGVLAAQYLSSWDVQQADAVLLAPAHTFLMNNQAVDYQFWLDIGSQGWWERLYQPLTHPIVLSRRWSHDRKWTDADENESNQQNLTHLLAGLIRRCREHIFLCAAGVDERGNRQRGPLIRAIQTILLSMNAAEE